MGSRSKSNRTWGIDFQLSPRAGFGWPPSPPTVWFVICKILSIVDSIAPWHIVTDVNNSLSHVICTPTSNLKFTSYQSGTYTFLSKYKTRKKGQTHLSRQVINYKNVKKAWKWERRKPSLTSTARWFSSASFFSAIPMLTIRAWPVENQEG